MKRHELLAALAAAAAIGVASSAGANVPNADAVVFEKAASVGTIASFQEFLTYNADSPYAEEALGQMIQLAASQTGSGHSVGGRGVSGVTGNQGFGPNPGVGNAGESG